ncbi:MAG: SlyX family protein [Dokdonella sp.]
MSASLEERLTELEMRIAFVDDTMNTLSEVVATHDRYLHDMRNAMEQLRSELVTVRGTLASDPQSEPPPPHY